MILQVADLPSFWSIIICATFHWDGRRGGASKHCITQLSDIFYCRFWQYLQYFIGYEIITNNKNHNPAPSLDSDDLLLPLLH